MDDLLAAGGGDDFSDRGRYQVPTTMFNISPGDMSAPKLLLSCRWLLLTHPR
jgi:hypothetical protein